MTAADVPGQIRQGMTAAFRSEPGTPLQALAVGAMVADCRRMVSRKAMLSAGASLVPIPGLDVAADVVLLMRLFAQINERFGLSEAQVEALAPDKRVLVYKAITAVGSTLVGSSITRQLVLKVLGSVSQRLAGRQLTRFVPLAGQAVSAVLAYSAMRYVCNQHIDDCARVVGLLRLGSSADGDRPGS
jgi:uncharacterized protein (DUF697 family)